MLFETSGQEWLFLILLWFGFVAAIIDGFLAYIFHKNTKMWLVITSDILRSIIYFLLFTFSIIMFCYAELRFYYFVAYFIGFIIEKKIFNKLVAKFFKFFYNIFVKFFTKIFRWFKICNKNLPEKQD